MRDSFHRSRWLRSAGLSLGLLVIFGLGGCNAWKRADTTAGLLAVPNVETDKLDGRQVIRMRGRLATAVIDPVGARVIDFHAGRRPRMFFDKADPNSQADPKMRKIDRPQTPNVFQPPGWSTSVEGCAKLDQSTYWQVEAWADHLVLLSDEGCGLRWRKTFDFQRESATLDITVELEDASGKPVPHGRIVSEMPTVGELRDEGATQRAWADGQWFGRQWLEGPASAEGFAIPPGRIKGFHRILWRERWWLRSDATATQPGDAPGQDPGAPPEPRPGEGG